MKFVFELTKEEIDLAKFQQLDDVRFKIELTVKRTHFVDILSQMVASKNQKPTTGENL